MPFFFFFFYLFILRRNGMELGKGFGTCYVETKKKSHL